MTASEPNLTNDVSDVEEISQNSGRIRVALEIAVAILVLVGIYYLFAPQEEIDLPPLESQEIDPIIREQIAAKQAPTPEQASSVVAETTGQTETRQPAAETPVAAAFEAAPVADGETARDLIAALRSGADNRPLAELDRLAAEFQQQGRPTDAYLLWFFAARQGDGQAAFSLGGLHDPNHFEAGSRLLTEADPTQAYKWYSLAAKREIPQALERLQALRTTLQKQADAGDLAANRLLLNWQ